MPLETEDEVLDEQQVEEQQEDQAADEGTQQSEADNQDSAATDEVVVSVGDEQSEVEQAPEWVREMRAKSREDQRRIRELEAKLNERDQKTAPQGPGPKPTIDQFDYDAEKFEAALGQWFERKREADQSAAEVARQQEEQDRAWKQKVEAYNTAKTALKVRGFADAEAAAADVLSVQQMALIVAKADNAPAVVVALGSNPARLKEFAAISDPLDFVKAVTKLEGKMKITPRTAPPPPEKIASGGAARPGSADATLDRLRAEADKTGDRSKVTRYLQQQMRQKRA